MDAIPELARLAEAHGLRLRVGGEANNKDPTAMLSAIAAVTTRLKVGSAILPMIAATSARPHRENHRGHDNPYCRTSMPS
jgi:alkanesulfonate monooxygenase SsuD/methylene tetrahydromethanopterin reductase-like flavin-dependent oxidoreductase (luciferase family)